MLSQSLSVYVMLNMACDIMRHVFLKIDPLSAKLSYLIFDPLEVVFLTASSG